MWQTSYERLTPAERAFVDGYVDSLDVEAARAGERMPAVLERRQPTPADIARSNGLLDRQHVQSAIVERVREITSNREITPSRVLNELEAIAHSNMRNYVDVKSDGWPDFDWYKISNDQWKAVKSFKIVETRNGRSYEVTLHDKIAALNMEMKYLGLTDEDNVHWKAERARRIGPAPMIDANATEVDAADAYTRLLESVAG